MPEREKVNPQTWFDILEVAKRLPAPFSSDDLARAAGLKATQASTIMSGPNTGKMGKGSTPQQHAAGWLSKFKKWGYVVVVDRVASSGPMPANAYQMTEEGQKVEKTMSLRQRFAILVAVLRDFIASIGESDHAEKWDNLKKTLEEVDPEGSTAKPTDSDPKSKKNK